MILGTYWFFDFPTGLYEFDYFQFRNGSGGFVDIPAELIAIVALDNPDKLLDDLHKLVSAFPETTLFIYREENKMKIEISGWMLFDYDFLIGKEVEKLLKLQNARLLNEAVFNGDFIKLSNTDAPKNKTSSSKKILQVVSSALKKHNAENASIRLDCHLSRAKKGAFISELQRIAVEEKLSVLYYFDNDFEGRTNLMMFFTNGRQGLGLENKKQIDLKRLGTKIKNTLLKFGGHLGHEGNYERYPQNGPKIEMIIDSDFIL